MDPTLVRTRIEEFERAAREKRADRLDREKLDWLRRVEHDKRIERRTAEDRRERDEMAAWEAALAPPERVAAFRVQLDDYDAHTVEALMENREALDAVQRRIERMLNEAYVLPDGRRVFKTEDGQRVYDERGQEVSHDVIDPNQISNDKPRWERVLDARRQAERLTAERQQLLDYQHKLDEARERLDRGEITNGELDRLQHDVAEKMPEPIRRKLESTGRDHAQTNERDRDHPATASNASALPVGTSQAPATLPGTASALLPADLDEEVRGNGLNRAPAGPKL